MPKTEKFDPLAYAATLVADQITPMDPIAWAKKKAGIEFWSKQREICRSVQNNKLTAVQSGHGVGKALSVNEFVPTPSGWSTISQLRVGDSVFDESGKVCKVTGKSDVWFGNTYRIVFSDGTHFDTHANHEWNAFDLSKRKKVPGVRDSSLKDWRDVQSYTETVTTEHISNTLKTTGGQNRWKVANSRSINLPEALLPVDPYTFGVWLGDGTSIRGEFTQNHTDAVEILEHIPYQTYIVPSTMRDNTNVYRVDGLYNAIRTMGCLGNKHIPMRYLRASTEQRRELVRGLMDADGYRRGGGDDEISISNKQLASDIFDLFVSLGLTVRISESDSKLNGRVVGRRWRIGCRFDFNPYHLSRYDWEPSDKQAARHTQRTVVEAYKIDSILTQCIEVDSPTHLFLAGRSLVPTHNSFTVSALAAWWVDTHPPEETMVVSTAPSSRQVSVIMWEGIRGIHRKAGLQGEVQRSDRWLIDDIEVGFGRKPQDYDQYAFQGIHRKYVLVIIDEAGGIDEWLWIAALALATGKHCRIIAIGNPEDPTSYFSKVCKPGSGWNRIQISVFDSPNFTGEKISQDAKDKLTQQDWVDTMEKQVGRDSPLWVAKVEGNFPDIDESSVIPLSWIYRANERWLEWEQGGKFLPETGRHVVGCDIARLGGDKSAVAHRYGHVYTDVHSLPKVDTEATADLIEQEIGMGPNDTGVIDTNGVGAGVFDKLRRKRLQVKPLNVGNRCSLKDKTGQMEYYNLRAAAMWGFREQLDPNQPDGAIVCLPVNDRLATSLAAARWKTMAGGKMVCEAKPEIKKRIGSDNALDEADAVILASWVNHNILDSFGEASYDWITEDNRLDEVTDGAISWETGVDDPDMSVSDYTQSILSDRDQVA